jgi:hypothetical protein
MISGVHISIFVMAVVQFIFIVPINFFIAWDCWCLGDLLYALIAGALSTVGAAISIQTLRLLIASRQEDYPYANGERQQCPGTPCRAMKSRMSKSPER